MRICISSDVLWKVKRKLVVGMLLKGALRIKIDNFVSQTLGYLNLTALDAA